MWSETPLRILGRLFAWNHSWSSRRIFLYGICILSRLPAKITQNFGIETCSTLREWMWPILRRRGNFGHCGAYKKKKKYLNEINWRAGRGLMKKYDSSAWIKSRTRLRIGGDSQLLFWRAINSEISQSALDFSLSLYFAWCHLLCFTHDGCQKWISRFFIFSSFVGLDHLFLKIMSTSTCVCVCVFSSVLHDGIRVTGSSGKIWLVLARMEALGHAVCVKSSTSSPIQMQKKK